jgi:RHS repeat-associated protein
MDRDSLPNVYLYRGEQYDPDLGLYYLRARYFNPLSGRFLTRAPAEGVIQKPKTLQKYLYVGGDPVNTTDPTGRPDFEEESLLSRIGAFAQRTIQRVGRNVGCVVQLTEDLLLVFTIDQTAQTGIEWLIGKAFRDFRLCLGGCRLAILGYLKPRGGIP